MSDRAALVLLMGLALLAGVVWFVHRVSSQNYHADPAERSKWIAQDLIVVTRPATKEEIEGR